VALSFVTVVCAAALAAGERDPIPPRGLLPPLIAEPFGGPEVVEDKVRLGVIVRCAGRPVEGVRLTVYRDRANRQELWTGTTGVDGAVRPLAPAQTAGGVVYAAIGKEGYSSPAHMRLSWEVEKGVIRIAQDTTEWESTARLGKWELAEGGAHVYFHWAQRDLAGELLELLLAQRRGVRELLGVELEPMGVIVVKDPSDEARYVTRKDGHTQRRGVFVHGIRSWPIVATSRKELNERPAELHEFHLVLPHELTENSLFNPALAGIEHRGTRWFRDGLAELVECTVPAADHPDLVAKHLDDRIEHLRQGLAAGDAKLDLLAWEQDFAGNSLPRYAAALAAMRRIVAKIGWEGLRGVLRAASNRMTTSSADLQSMLAEAGAKDLVGTLNAVDADEAVKMLEALKGNLKKQE
jgi:hypothetical protein